MLFPVTMIVTNSFKHFPESKYHNLQKVLFRHCSIGNHKMLQCLLKCDCKKCEKPTLLLGVGGPDPVDGLAAQVRVDAGVLGLGGQLGQVAATLAAVLTSQQMI